MLQLIRFNPNEKDNHVITHGAFLPRCFCGWETLIWFQQTSLTCFMVLENWGTEAGCPPCWLSAQPNILTLTDKNKAASSFFPLISSTTKIFLHSIEKTHFNSDFMLLLQNSSKIPPPFPSFCLSVDYFAFCLLLFFFFPSLHNVLLVQCLQAHFRTGSKINSHVFGPSLRLGCRYLEQ